MYVYDSQNAVVVDLKEKKKKRKKEGIVLYKKFFIGRGLVGVTCFVSFIIILNTN